MSNFAKYFKMLLQEAPTWAKHIVQKNLNTSKPSKHKFDFSVKAINLNEQININCVQNANTNKYKLSLRISNKPSIAAASKIYFQYIIETENS